MYFTECARLAERHPELAGTLQQVDAQLRTMGTAEVIRPDVLASFLKADPNQVGSVLELLAREGLLQSEEMVECEYCSMTALRSDYEAVGEDDGEYRCTSCGRRLGAESVRNITTYRQGEKWVESPRPTHHLAGGDRRKSRKLQSRRAPSRKRAARDANIGMLKRAIRQHIRSARDHAQALVDKGKEPLLLPRPTQKLLAEQLGLSRAAVCRALHDETDRELQILWAACNDLSQVMRVRD